MGQNDIILPSALPSCFGVVEMLNNFVHVYKTARTKVKSVIAAMESKTNRGTSCIIYENNKFTLHYEGKHRATWRCTNKKCKSKLFTKKGDTKSITINHIEHNHEDAVTDVQGHVFRERCKEKVTECMLSKPEVVICSELSKVLDTSTVLPKDIHLAKRAMYRAKRRNLPTYPKTLSESVERVQLLDMTTSRGESFLLYADDGIIIFTCTTNLQYLCSA